MDAWPKYFFQGGKIIGAPAPVTEFSSPFFGSYEAMLVESELGLAWWTT